MKDEAWRQLAKYRSSDRSLSMCSLSMKIKLLQVVVHQHCKLPKSHSSSLDQEPACGISRGPGGHKAPKEIQSEDLGKAISRYTVFAWNF